MPGIELFKSFLEQASAQSSKSTAMKPLNWLIVTLIGGTLSSFYLKLPYAISIVASILTGLSIVVYLIVYFYFLFTDKDALRSEKFIVQKLAIERGFVGDNLFGKLELGEEKSSKDIDASIIIDNK